MNIYLIHGDNNLESYNRLQEYIGKAKSKEWEIITIDEKDTSIMNTLRSNSLFNLKRLIVVKGYSLLNDNEIEFINNSKDDIELIIYHENNIPVTFIKKINIIKKNEIFKLSKYLWKFIDSFYPGNVKNCLYYFHGSVKSDPVELIFSILTGHLRDIYLTLFSDNPLSYQQWRLQNIKRQSNKFRKEIFLETINELANIDIKVKTSNANLKDELDLFILRKLE